MSGIGEAIAIVSCVAGLIQAWDASGRIVRQIKQRRETHRAQPISSILERSVERGKEEIEILVAEGRERLGDRFNEGDAIVISALKDVTIATQQAYLEGLAAAREDDSITDFTATIRASDRARSHALIILHNYILRKEEEEDRGVVSINVQEPSLSPPSTIDEQAAHLRLSPGLNSSISTTLPSRIKTGPVSLSTSQSSASTRKASFGFLRRKLSEPAQQPVPARSERSRTSIGEGAASTPNGSTASRPDSYSATSSRQSGSEKWPSVSDADSLYAQDSPASTRPVSFLSTSRTNTQSTSATDLSTSSAITNYGGCCKYAHRAREGKLKKAVMLQNLSLYSERWIYSCASVKCQFRGQALRGPKGAFHIDDRVLQCHGILFRWVFLAKSHVAQEQVTDKPPYRCLICVMLGEDAAQTYHGFNALLEHVAGHQGCDYRGTVLEGPLTFSNDGINYDDNFDILLPVSATPSPILATEKSLFSISENGMQHLRPKMEIAAPKTAIVTCEMDVLSLDSNPWI